MAASAAPFSEHQGKALGTFLQPERHTPKDPGEEFDRQRTMLLDKDLIGLNR
jgi:hypothetical protein